jgi:dTDP-glucose pyrophosphorylase
MAGYNTRFHDVGFDVPKYLLPWNGKTIINEIVRNFRNHFGNIILLANKRDLYFKDQLLKTLKEFKITESDIYYIGDTRGQAHTAAIGADILSGSTGPLFIHNSDTIVTGRALDKVIAEFTDPQCLVAGYVDVFVGNSPKYSYVRAYENTVIEVVEKKQISPFASSGLYGFKNAELYLQTFTELAGEQGKEELYVSNILDDMIKSGDRVIMNEISHVCETIVLGSPQEYGIELARQSLGMK